MTRFGSRGGVGLACGVAGAGGSAVIFLHGWSGGRSCAAPPSGHCAAGGAVAARGGRGHGVSGRPGPGGDAVAALAGAARAVAAAAGVTGPVVVGRRRGALAGRAGAARPGAIRALVMVDPAPVTNEAARAFAGPSVEAIGADGDRSWRTALVRGMVWPPGRGPPRGHHPGHARGLPGDRRRTDPGHGRVRRCQRPGARSPCRCFSIGSAVPAHAPADLRRARPAITTGQTAGAGHFHQLEVPGQVTAMIEQFMAINHLYHRTASTRGGQMPPAHPQQPGIHSSRHTRLPA